ncbi:ABC transporter ATP-binding protein [Streptomyces sp. NPDC055189]
MNRPVLAGLIETTLQAVPGIEKVHASPVTGRVLVLHDHALNAGQAARSLRQALVHSFDRAADLHDSRPGSPRDAAGTRPPGARRPAGQKTADNSASRRPLALIAGVVGAAAALGCGKSCATALLHPVVSLGVVTVATAAVIRRAWRRSGGGQVPPGAAQSAHGRHSLSRIIGPHRRLFFRAALLTVLAQAAESALFATVSFAVMTVARNGSVALVSLGLSSLLSQLSFLAAAGAVACVAVTGLGYAADVAWRKLGHTVEHDWRTSTYAAVQRLPQSDLESERTSRTARVLTEDISKMGAFVAGGLQDLVALAASVTVLVPAFLLIAPQIAWAVFAPVPLIAWLSFRHHERARAHHAQSGEGRARLHARLVDNLQAGATIKASCAQEHEEARIAELGAQYSAASFRAERCTAFQAQAVRLCAMAALPITLLFGGRAVAGGSLGLEPFSLLVELPGQALWRIRRLGPAADQYREALATLEHAERLHQLPPETDGAGLALRPEQVAGEISLKDVTFAYPERPPALKDLSMSIAAGQVTGLVGATGAGKTTIAKLLMRFQRADMGEVLLDGVNVGDLRLRDLRSAIGYVAQEPFLFDGTIADNIRYGTFEAQQSDIAHAARSADADTFIEALPAGYDTMVGERGVALSGGQRQRIALARTILRNPPIVILDEATSAVDNETEAAIQRALHAFSTNRTLIVIAHRLSTVRNADKIYVMDHGGVAAEEGTHAALLEKGGRYAELWRLQAGGAVPIMG